MNNFFFSFLRMGIQKGMDRHDLKKKKGSQLTLIPCIGRDTHMVLRIIRIANETFAGCLIYGTHLSLFSPRRSDSHFFLFRA